MDEYSCYPKTIVVSNNSFSKNSNNGRTLGNLFTGWPKDKLAQFCISTIEPDYDVCDNYYLLTDKSILDGVKHFRKGKRCDVRENIGTEGNTIINGRKAVKTPWKMLIRHCAWGGKRWLNREFQEWLDTFSPDIVVVMNSDATFILDIASYIASERSIPLVLFNTEGFYFFKYNYFRKSKIFNKIGFQLYQKIYRHHFNELMGNVILSIHLNSMLADDYKKKFGGEHIVIYTSSNIEFDKSNLHIEKPIFSYLGNFGFNRPTALIEIAEVLQSINPNYILDIYGRIPNQNIKNQFYACSGINYKGMLPYNEVIHVMHNSTILFHAEVQSDKFKEMLRYGFTTKIADSISSGHPFLMYSSPDIAGAQYIIENGAGWHAKDKNELASEIISILTNDKKRNEVLDIAQKIAMTNHNLENNSKVFRQTLAVLSQKTTKNI